MFSIAFVDDNTDFLNTEIIIAKNYLLSKNINFKISEFKSGIDLINHQEISSFDLILLDYEMEGMTGFETARLIRKNNYNVPIAFVTVFYEFSREGYRFDAIRYLIKHEPNFNLELCDCLNKAIQLKQIKTKNIKYFDFIDKHIQLNVENIVYIQSDKHYLLYYILVKNNLVCFKKRSKMSEAIEDLSDYCFFSLIRTGLLINLKYVKSINKRGIICIEAGENISKLFIISDSNIDKFLSHYMKYLGDL